MTLEAAQPPSSLRILSLNCWGLKFISKLRNERLTEIGVQIAAASPRPDIVGLQECWTQQDYNVIREKTQHILPYGKFYHSGIFGGGLVILSRWPIIESNMVRYPLNGRPAAFYRGDWFVGKGVACARIQMGPSPGDIAEVFCTHVCSYTLMLFHTDCVAPRPVRSRTARLLHMSPDSASMGDYQTDARGSRTGTPRHWHGRLQHGSPIPCAPHHRNAFTRSRRMAHTPPRIFDWCRQRQSRTSTRPTNALCAVQHDHKRSDL